jgi:hypothetical protein
MARPAADMEPVEAINSISWILPRPNLSPGGKSIRKTVLSGNFDF